MIEPTLDTGTRPSDVRRPIVVLLVDDQPFVGAAVGMLLQSEGDIELHCCTWAVNAIALANQIDPTVVLQDLVMPEIDGLTLVRSFRENALTADTPVIVLSGNDDEATRARALAAGAKGYLVKLPAKAALIACLREHGSRSAAHADPLEPVDHADTLDLSVIEGFRSAGVPEFTRRLIDQFIIEAGTRVETLRDAAGRTDAPALKAIAHSLKGTSMIMGATRLANLCGRIEADLAGSTPGVVPPALMTEIDQELVRVQHALAEQR